MNSMILIFNKSMYTVTRGIFLSFIVAEHYADVFSWVSLVSVWISSSRNSHFLHICIIAGTTRVEPVILWRGYSRILSCLLSPFLLSSLPPCSLPPFHNSFLSPSFLPFFIPQMDITCLLSFFKGMCQHWKSKKNRRFREERLSKEHN